MWNVINVERNEMLNEMWNEMLNVINRLIMLFVEPGYLLNQVCEAGW